MKKSSMFIAILMVLISIVCLSSCTNKKKEPPYVAPVIPPPNKEEPISNFFTYNYNEATSCNQDVNIELLPYEFSNIKLITPKREGYYFDGWYADWYLSKRVSDNQGQIIIGEELFDNKNRNLYAKWKKEDAPVYPILMVFATEIDAVLPASDGTRKQVKYSMTELERKIMENIAILFKQYLDALLNGFVNFKVDTYFTTTTIGYRSFNGGIVAHSDSTFSYEYSLVPFYMPELGGMEQRFDGSGNPPEEEIIKDGSILSKYKSVITTFNMNDYDEMLHIAGGSGRMKYAFIHMETLFNSFYIQDVPLEDLFDLDRQGMEDAWVSYMNFYLHEFTHSVELYPENKTVNNMDFHDVIKKTLLKFEKGPSGLYEIEIMRRYLSYEIILDEEVYGIPPEFWS